MGMYDLVLAKCYSCGSTIEFQSKGGDCNLTSYSLYDAPPEVLGDIVHDTVQCEKCGSSYCVQVISIAHLVPLKLRSIDNGI